MKLRSALFCATALLAPLAACGGSDDNNSGTRPSVSDLESSIRDAAGLEAGEPDVDSLVNCIATDLHGSDIPNGVLRKVAAGEDAEVDSSNEDRYNKILEDITTNCTTAAMTAG